MGRDTEMLLDTDRDKNIDLIGEQGHIHGSPSCVLVGRSSKMAKKSKKQTDHRQTDRPTDIASCRNA